MSEPLPTFEELSNMKMTELYEFARQRTHITKLRSYRKDRKPLLVSMIAKELGIPHTTSELLRSRIEELYKTLQQFPREEQVQLLAPYFSLYQEVERIEEQPLFEEPVEIEEKKEEIISPPVPVPVIAVEPTPQIINYSPHENNPWRRYNGGVEQASTIPIDIVTYRDILNEITEQNIINPIEYIPKVEQNIQKCLGLI